jgi:hypothetical protein
MEGISAQPPLAAAASDGAGAGLGRDLRRALRGLPSAARIHLLRRALLLLLPLALLSGIFIGWSCKAWIGLGASGQPYHLIAGSIVLNLLLLSAWVMWLPREHERWQFVFSWVAWTLAAGCGHAGLWLSGGESARTFAVLWLLTIGQGALLGAICGAGAVLLSGRMQAARQISMLILAAAMTAIFWSKTPIQSAQKDENDRGLPMGDLLYDAVLKLSPPLAVCATWYQESDASRGPVRSDNSRFDLIRGPLSYSVWMGSYQIIPYPDILPVKAARAAGSSEPQTARLGLALTTLLWGLPLMMLADLLLMLLFMRKAPKHVE